MFQDDWTGCINSFWCVARFFGSAIVAAIVLVWVAGIFAEWIDPSFGQPKLSLRQVFCKKIKGLNELLHRL
jgi:hypothetical protein